MALVRGGVRLKYRWNKVTNKFSKLDQYLIEAWSLAVVATALAHDGKQVGEIIFLVLSCLFVIYGVFVRE